MSLGFIDFTEEVIEHKLRIQYKDMYEEKKMDAL